MLQEPLAVVRLPLELALLLGHLKLQKLLGRDCSGGSGGSGSGGNRTMGREAAVGDERGTWCVQSWQREFSFRSSLAAALA